MKQTASLYRTFLRSMALAAMLLHSLLQAPGALADTSVWEVSRGDALLYLGGTIHALRPSDYPLPEEFEYAYAAADEIYFEVDLKAALDPAFQATALQSYSYNDGRSLYTVLSEEVYTDFYTLAGRFGIPAGALDNLKPSPATTTVLFLELGNIGFGPQGVEMHFLQQAERDALSQGSLESLEFQTSLLANLGEGNEDAMVADFLEQIGTLEDYMNEAVSAWREGDIGRIDEYLLTDMAEEFPEDFEAMFTRRNRNWLPQIMAMLDDADIEFVLVGVGHMPREDGLLELLRREGATVRLLDLQER
ncbi:MAG: TraB/GumN family protein [Gammaproteobacteria bacterium]|nr:TraB/GumN family protein [Gammaproteobacteria bacterium]MYE30066.1 TraB/GumN family protein [Gammaproteobacteria bacterium]MYI02744.1 TraB/GumN family protein [Gammaproteobacteria bacterium]